MDYELAKQIVSAKIETLKAVSAENIHIWKEDIIGLCEDIFGRESAEFEYTSNYLFTSPIYDPQTESWWIGNTKSDFPVTLNQWIEKLNKWSMHTFEEVCQTLFNEHKKKAFI